MAPPSSHSPLDCAPSDDPRMASATPSMGASILIRSQNFKFNSHQLQINRITFDRGPLQIAKTVGDGKLARIVSATGSVCVSDKCRLAAICEHHATRVVNRVNRQTVRFRLTALIRSRTGGKHMWECGKRSPATRSTANPPVPGEIVEKKTTWKTFVNSERDVVRVRIRAPMSHSHMCCAPRVSESVSLKSTPAAAKWEIEDDRNPVTSDQKTTPRGQHIEILITHRRSFSNNAFVLHGLAVVFSPFFYRGEPII